MASTLSGLTSKQLRQAASLREKIDKLDRQLAAILGAPTAAPVAVRRAGRKRRASSAPAPQPKRKRRFSKAARAKMAAAAKKRWAAAKAAGRKSL